LLSLRELPRVSAERRPLEGASVVAIARSEARLASLAQELKAHGVGSTAMVADCLDETAVRDVVSKVKESYGRIDVLVNSIGGSTVVENSMALVEEMTLADFERVVEFNLVPTFLMCKYVGPVMKAQKSGKIVNMSSMASRGESQAGSAYGAAKAGIISFTRKLSRELGPWGVNCNGIAPALVLTDRINRTIGAVSPEVAAERARNIPLRRNSMPEDQALVVAFRASSDADMITGVTIDVTGGL
jgi:NAD(P)-dependent dehydrogenase (short-subunit alcohol dehydrogenase family)